MSTLCLASRLCRSPEPLGANAAFESCMWSGNNESGSCDSGSCDPSSCESRSTVPPLASLSPPSSTGLARCPGKGLAGTSLGIRRRRHGCIFAQRLRIRDKISYLCTDEPRTTGFPSSDTSAVSPSEKIEHLRSESPTRDKIRLSYLISYQQRRSASGHTRTRAWARSCPTRGLVLRARAC
jgi:hypothetical protein